MILYPVLIVVMTLSLLTKHFFINFITSLDVEAPKTEDASPVPTSKAATTKSADWPSDDSTICTVNSHRN